MAMRIVEVLEKSMVETRTYRGHEKRWVEPGESVVVVDSRTRIFSQEQWEALLPPSGRDWDSGPGCDDWE